MNNHFKKFDLIGGWFCFVFASMVYLLTIEPTTSFWDCSEFIATSYKLEIGHPPGNPLFMLMARLFTMFTGPQMAAPMINAMSALASGAAVMFLFWTITHMARRAVHRKASELSQQQTIAIVGAGLIGALTYTFTDTFWFSAVEGEVYGLSSFFTAVAFWAILKWENVADEPHANRWLILVAYITGLAIGVHLINLLITPCIALVYYFRKYTVTKWGFLKALMVCGLILFASMFVVISGTIELGAWVDRFFVNTLGLPVNSGITFYAFAVFGILAWGIYLSHVKGKVVLNTILLCTTVMLLGYSVYASVVIRSAVNPPMNSNAPDNPYGLLALLNRDQYGARPLLKGPAYTVSPTGVEYKTVYFEDENGKYNKAEELSGYTYDPRLLSYFPRMHSVEPGHQEAYKNWVPLQGKSISVDDQKVVIPSFGEELKFFFAYQLNFMYWRYFLWNFVGRQSDIQSTGEISDGNWLSGINAIDEIFLGPQDNIPSEMAQNKGRNTFYFLPFILGIIGLIYQLNRDGRNFTVVMSFFIMTGIAIVIYLNTPPAEPRERDYVYVGCFYAFCMWIGFGVLALYEAFKRWLKKDKIWLPVAATLIGAVVPAILGAQNWNDHDRSGRYVARDFGKNYLNSTLPNAILIDYGDNDTFPLWYAQEVEGVRKDVRVMNWSYLSGEWYIDQMKIKSNDSDPVPFFLPRQKYYHNNGYLTVIEKFKSATGKQVINEWVASNNPVTQFVDQEGTSRDYIPTKKIAIPVNKENAIASGIVKPEDAHLMVDTVYIELKRNAIMRNELMLLDLLANFDWKRPIYFTQAYSPAELGLQDYLQLDGFAYRLVPIKTPGDYFSAGRIDSKDLYDKLMNKFDYGNIADPKVYADYTIQTNFNATQARTLYARLANQLLEEGDTTRAINVLNTGIEKIPFNQIRHSFLGTLPLVESYYMAGAMDKGNEILNDYATNLQEYITYYLRFTGIHRKLVTQQLDEKVRTLYNLYQLANTFKQEPAQKIEQFFKEHKIM